MTRTRDNFEIGNGVIQLVPVSMVNDFGRLQFAPEMDSHDVPVFEGQLPFNVDLPISMLSNGAFAVSRFLAKVWRAVPLIAKVMGIAQAMTLYLFVASLNGAEIRNGVLDEPASLVLNHSVHGLSSAVSISQTLTARNGGSLRVNSEKPLTRNGEGNPERSREYTRGTCNDYRRGLAPLMTGKSARLEREDIVYSSWKHEVERFITDCDGVGVTIPLARATNGGIAAAGVVASSSIASGDYGLVQVYGYHSAVRVRSLTIGIPAIAKGRPLVMNAAGSVFCLESVSTASTTILVNQIGFALAANASWTTLAKAAFIKCL